MLETLIAVVKAKPKERELCCPDCGADVVLREGLYRCSIAPIALGPPELPHGQSAFRSLADLAVRNNEDCPF